MAKSKIGVIQIYRPMMRSGLILEDDGLRSYRFSRKDMRVKFKPRVGQKVLYQVSDSKKTKAVDIRPYAYE
tara:strand:- start:268 stop:480 length:213 start_codon:yes stop_codon:yes gene_type:complete